MWEQGLERNKARWITTIFFILSGLLSATWSSRIPQVQQGLGLDDGAWGIVLAALPVGLVTGILFSSWLVAHFGTRRVMTTSCILMAFFLALLGIIDERGLLMIALFFMGVFRTILNISVNTRSMEVQQLYDKPIVSLFHGIWSIACFAAASIGTLMIIYGIIPAIHFLSIAVPIAILALVFGKMNPAAHNKPVERRPFFIKPDRYLLLLGTIAFCIMICESTMFDWSVNYYEKVVKPGKGLVTAGYTAFIIAMAFGRLFGDRFIARYGTVRILVFNGLLMAVGFAIASVFPYIIPATFAFLVIGIGDSILIPIVYTLAASSKKMQPSYALASVSLIGSTGFIAGPLLIGMISDAWGMSTAFGIVALLSVCITMLTLVVKKYL
jgi:MFS family permease